MGRFGGTGAAYHPRFPRLSGRRSAPLPAYLWRSPRDLATCRAVSSLLIAAGLLLLCSSAAAKLPERARDRPSFLQAYGNVLAGPVRRLAPRPEAPLPAVCPRVAETVAKEMGKAVPNLHLRILLTIVEPVLTHGFYMPGHFLQANKAYEQTGDVSGWVFQTTVLATDHQAGHVVLDPFYVDRNRRRDGWDSLERWALNFFGPKAASEQGGPFHGSEFGDRGAWVFAFPPERQRPDFEDSPGSGRFGRAPKITGWEPISLPELLRQPDHLSVRRTTPWTPASLDN